MNKNVWRFFVLARDENLELDENLYEHKMCMTRSVFRHFGRPRAPVKVWSAQGRYS